MDIIPGIPAAQADHDHNGSIDGCPLFRMLPEGLRVRMKDNHHLWDYIHLIPIQHVGIPEFHLKLDRSMKDNPDPNIIYPVDDSVFIHIMADPEDSRNHYVSIEPSMAADVSSLLAKVEEAMVGLIEQLDTSNDEGSARAELLLKVLNQVCTIGSGGNGKKKGLFHSKNGGKIRVTQEQLLGLRYILVREKVGMGIIEPLILDPYIEDISCSGVGPIFVEHKIFDSLKASVGFTELAELDGFVIRLSEKIGKPVTFRDPVVDVTLLDGSRINIVFGSDLSKRGSNFTIRKVSDTPFSILDLIEFKSLNYQVAAYLSLVIAEGMNIFVSGETASGKTTLLNALTTFISPNAKIVSIEDTAELQVPHPNWIREVVRGGGKSTSDSSVTMYDLLKAALRQRPNEIIIGEIRGEEGAIAFQAMQTGHACMATSHAATVEKLIQRLSGNPINVPKTYIDNLNVVAIQSAVRLPSGKFGRRVISVNEIIGYDPQSDSFSFIEVFQWDTVTDVFEFAGDMNSYLLEHKIAVKRGIPPTEKRKIYKELERRARILEKIHKKGETNFYGLYKILSAAYRQGLFR